MKSTTAIKNIRLFKNAQNGRPKRVTTGVDDYGNRFHVVKGKVKPVLNKIGKLRKVIKPYIKDSSGAVPKNPKNINKLKRHSNSARLRDRQFWKLSSTGKLTKSKTDKLKQHIARKEDYHNARKAMLDKDTTGYHAIGAREDTIKAAKALHGKKRKAKVNWV